MAKRITTSNVIPFRATASKRTSIDAEARADADALRQAEQMVIQARNEVGKQRTTLARKALLISPNCVSAYLVLSDENTNVDERIELLRKAIEAGCRCLGSNWEQMHKGHGWGVIETRPVMQAMAQLAMELQGERQFDEALELYRRLLRLNPSDNQGMRYKLAGCLFEARCEHELTKLLAEWKDDPSAELKYVEALQLFRKEGSSKRASQTLMVAFERNPYVPAYVSDLMEMPDEQLTHVGIGDESEAADYAMTNSYMWWDTKGATTWMAETLAPLMHKRFPEERKLMDAVIKELKKKQ